jgi:hypothetical protein
MSNFFRMANGIGCPVARNGPCEYSWHPIPLGLKVPGQDFDFPRVHGSGAVVTLKGTNIARIFINEAGCWAQTRYYCHLAGSLRV